jgi:hypothetical protein
MKLFVNSPNGISVRLGCWTKLEELTERQLQLLRAVLQRRCLRRDLELGQAHPHLQKMWDEEWITPFKVQHFDGMMRTQLRSVN